MIISQTVAYTPRATALAARIATLSGCIGCADCKGLCSALIEVLTVPEYFVRRRGKME